MYVWAERKEILKKIFYLLTSFIVTVEGRRFQKKVWELNKRYWNGEEKWKCGYFQIARNGDSDLARISWDPIMKELGERRSMY